MTKGVLMASMSCPVCEGGTAKKIKRAYRTKYNGQIVSLPSVEMFRCSNCQEEFFSPEQARSLSVEVKNAVRQSSGLLAPEKILAIREKLGLTQTQLEHLFDQGPKVVTRWESGRVIQNKNADTILRMLDRDPKLLLLVKQIEKARDEAQRKHAKPEPLELAVAR
jgi:putative zinc finger/helix-turn-helix YgiT family protein